jgi:hypothetical protein
MRPAMSVALEGERMTLLEAGLIVVGVGFGLAAISFVRIWNGITGPKPSIADLAVPFLAKWALYSGGVALALGIQYLLVNARG